jgi:O-antigen/teichoic acid export membrane protein
MTRSRVSSRIAGALPDWTRFWLTDSAVLLASQLLTTVASSAVAIVIARQLDPGDWGIFAGFFGLSIALSIVVQFGAGAWLLRELSALFSVDEPDAEARALVLLHSALVVNALLAGLVLAAGAAAAELTQLERGVEVALICLLGYGGLTAGATLVEAQLRARRRIGRVAAANFLEKALLLAVVASISLLGGGIALIGLAYVGAAIARLLFVYRAATARAPQSVSRPSWSVLRRLVRGSLPFALTDGCLNVVPKLDALLLVSLSATSAGFFALGDRILGPALMLQGVLSITLFPFFARKENQQVPPWALVAMLALLGGAAAVALFFAAPALVPLLFGDKYAAAVHVVQVFALALPLVFASGPLRVFAFARYREARVVVVVLAASLAGTVAIVTGQWTFGAVAAAGGYVLRQALFTAGLAFISVRATATSEPGQATTRRSAAVEGVS